MFDFCNINLNKIKRYKLYCLTKIQVRMFNIPFNYGTIFRITSGILAVSLGIVSLMRITR